MSQIPTKTRKKRTGVPKSPVAPQLSRFRNHGTPKSAVDLMLACATTGEALWATELTPEVAAKIASMPALEEKFLNNLCRQPGLPHAGEVMGAYLQAVGPEGRDRLFAPAEIQRKNHFTTTCFYGASFSSASGHNLTKVVAHMLDNGLCAESLITRNIPELQRAASLGHKALLQLMIPRLSNFPEEVIRSVLQNSMHPIESISILVDECGLPMTTFCNPKFLAGAKATARCYISSRLSRMCRIPEMEAAEDDSCDDLFTPTSAKTPEQPRYASA